MNLLQRIFGRGLSSDWEVTPGGIVWKLQPTAGGILIGEARNVEERTLSLFAVRPSTGQLLFSGVALDEPWWIALEMTIGEVAIFHSFPRPDMPSSIGATAVDCATGDVLWSDDGIRVLCGVEELALVQRGPAHDWTSLEVIDARSGALLERIGDDLERAAAFQRACDDGTQWHGWVNAHTMEPEEDRARLVTTTLDRVMKERRGAPEIAELGGYTVIAAHERSRRSPEAMLGNLVDTRLLVLHGDRLVHNDIVTRDAPGPAEDLFFLWHGVLVVIRDRRTLSGINLIEG